MQFLFYDNFLSVLIYVLLSLIYFYRVDAGNCIVLIKRFYYAFWGDL